MDFETRFTVSVCALCGGTLSAVVTGVIYQSILMFAIGETSAVATTLVILGIMYACSKVRKQ